MKNSEKRAAWISRIIFAVLAGVVIVLIMGCTYMVKWRRERYPIIRAVQQSLGKDVTLWEVDSNHNVLNYTYLLNTYEKDIIALLELTLNNLQNKPQNKIRVAICDRFHGGEQCPFVFENFSWQGKMTDDGKFTYLTICNLPCRGTNTDFFLNPEIYTALSDVRYLRIEESMQKLAEEAGIDWYEVWPNLESAESYTRGETGDEIYTKILRKKGQESDPVITAIQQGLGEDVTLCGFDSNSAYYVYLLNTREKNVIARLESTLNNLPDKPQNAIRVAIYDPFLPGAKQAVFELRNCSWQGKMTGDGKFTCLEIYYRPCRGNNTDFYQNPEIYTALSDIRYLRIEEPMQKLAEEAGIDWYKAWPNLESAESYKKGELGKEIYTKIWNREELESNPIITAVQQGLGEDVTLCYYNTGHYEYLLNTYEKDVIARLEAALNNLPNKPQNEICVGIVARAFEGAPSFFTLNNYSWQGERTEDGKFTYLEISDPPNNGNNIDFFLNPEIYTALSDVRYLRISELMQSFAEEIGIDWYEVWPNLESAELHSWAETGDEIYIKILRN